MLGLLVSPFHLAHPALHLVVVSQNLPPLVQNLSLQDLANVRGLLLSKITVSVSIYLCHLPLLTP